MLIKIRQFFIGKVTIKIRCILIEFLPEIVNRQVDCHGTGAVIGSGNRKVMGFVLVICIVQRQRIALLQAILCCNVIGYIGTLPAFRQRKASAV